jgi:hypothetical protein
LQLFTANIINPSYGVKYTILNVLWPMVQGEPRCNLLASSDRSIMTNIHVNMGDGLPAVILDMVVREPVIEPINFTIYWFTNLDLGVILTIQSPLDYDAEGGLK